MAPSTGTLGLVTGEGLRTCRTFKSSFTCEPYLHFAKNAKHKVARNPFKIRSHRFMLQNGRNKNLVVADRLHSECLELEEHHWMRCRKLRNEKAALLKLVYDKFPNAAIVNNGKNFAWIKSIEDQDIKNKTKLVHMVYMSMHQHSTWTSYVTVARVVLSLLIY